MMINYKLLQFKLREARMTKKQFAARLGLSYAGFQAKIRRKAEFKASEIYLARDILKLSAEDVTRIFFGEAGDERCSPIRNAGGQ